MPLFWTVRGAMSVFKERGGAPERRETCSTLTRGGRIVCIRNPMASSVPC